MLDKETRCFPSPVKARSANHQPITRVWHSIASKWVTPFKFSPTADCSIMEHHLPVHRDRAYDVQPFVAWMQHFQSLILVLFANSSFMRSQRQFWIRNWNLWTMVIHLEDLLPKQIVWVIILSFSVDHPTCLVSLSAFGTPTMLICAACWFDPSSDLNSCSANGCWLNALVDLHHLAPTLRSSLGPNPTRSPIAISLPLWDLGFSRTDFSI